MADKKNSSIPTLLIYTTVALLLLFLLTHSPSSSSHHRQAHRRLKLRSSPSTSSSSSHHITFDPVISTIEQRREDKAWEKEHYNFSSSTNYIDPTPPEPEWEDFMDAEDYINDEEKFNVTDRILTLFPKLDVAPVDGFISSDELVEWNIKQAENEILHRTKRDLELHDKNRDGFIAFHEYQEPNWARSMHHDDNSSDSIGWWKEDHFNASDADGDGLLNLTEFNDFLHPADSKNPKLMEWLCKEEIRAKDKNHDGKLDFQEFYDGLFSIVRDDGDILNSSHENDASPEQLAKKSFSHLDQDNDGFLSANELKPIIDHIHPSERYYAKQQADYTLSQADTDKDGRLSLKEMIENPYVFYSSIFYDEDDYGYHDEFR